MDKPAEPVDEPEPENKAAKLEDEPAVSEDESVGPVDEPEPEDEPAVQEGEPAGRVDEPEDKAAGLEGRTPEEVVAPRVAGADPLSMATPAQSWGSSRLGPLTRVALVVLSLLRPGKVSGFGVYDCANTPNRVDIYFLLELAACPLPASHHAWRGQYSEKYTGRAADSQWNLRYKFLRTYTPLSEELYQTGKETDIYIGADDWHLPSQYIEQEMRNGPLHIYKSVFGCGYILRGMEPLPKSIVASVDDLEQEDEPAVPED
jgi:hypothetical protein